MDIEGYELNTLRGARKGPWKDPRLFRGGACRRRAGILRWVGRRGAVIFLLRNPEPRLLLSWCNGGGARIRFAESNQKCAIFPFASSSAVAS